MKIQIKSAFLLLLFFSTFTTSAVILLYPFSDPEKEERFNSLITELRCPKCQNNNLSDSNAPLSVDLKDIIYEKIQAGETDNEIIYFLKQRYGDFISYRPPVKPSTWLIWYGPFVLLLVGGFLIFRFVSARQSNVTREVSVSTSNSSEDLIASWKEEIDNEAEKS